MNETEPPTCLKYIAMAVRFVIIKYHIIANKNEPKKIVKVFLKWLA